jgi:TolB-like protein/Tfp pilus assembly protein PilF
MSMELTWRGDLAAAEETLRQIPASALQEDRANYSAGLLRYYQRDAASAQEAWGSFPRDFYVDFVFDGPKGLLLGLADELDHRDAAARTEWRAALQQVEKKIAAAPNRPGPYYSQAYLLACLGEKAAAGEALRTHEQLAQIKYAPGQGMLIPLAKVYARLGRFDEIFAHFSGSRALLQISPDFDTLRADPRFQQWITRTSAAKPVAEKPPAEAAAKVDEKSVAVLAFANLSDDKANEYFSDGISEELLNVLAKVPGLKVTARTSSFHFKGKDTSIPEIAQQLGVAYVVEGSVRKSGDKVRITAQLIKAADGFHLWSETFTRDLKDVFAVQDEIAGLIAKNLELKMDGAARVGVAVDPEAYRLYLEGRQILQRRTQESYAQAEKLFAEAKTRAPDWAPVYAGLADVWRLRAFATDVGPTGPNAPWLPTMQEAKRLADRALELDPTLAEAYVSLAGTNMIAWNFPEAERLIHRALELNPNQADAYLVLGRVMSAEGRIDESIAALRRAVDLNPLAPRILDNLAAELGFIGRYEEAWAIIERANALQPDSSQIQCYRVRLLADMGRRDDALALARRMVENATPEEREFRLLEAARVHVMFGMKAAADAVAAQIPANVPEHVIALAYLGTPERAVPLLDQLIFGWIEDLLWGPSFDPIRHDPGYVAYLARTGLTEANARAQAWRAAHPPQKPETKP